jgi:hypothetical protein
MIGIMPDVARRGGSPFSLRSSGSKRKKKREEGREEKRRGKREELWMRPSAHISSWPASMKRSWSVLTPYEICFL